MPSHFTLRMQFGPHQDPADITDQLLKLTREAPVDELMAFFFAEEMNDGHDPLERIQLWIERSRPYREALKKTGVAISLNPWHSMLHCDRGRTLKPGQEWQRMVDFAGQQAQAVICFLDPAWRRYYDETLRLYAQEKFRVVWIDDDIRYHNHDPLQWGGCFCPLHVAEFNRRAGTTATREEIVIACLQPGTPHPWRAIWLDMWQETILTFLTECRQILEKGGTKMGLMSSGMEAHGAEGRRWGEWWQAFGGGEPPVHRPHFWDYSDTSGPMLLYGISALDQNRSIQPDMVESGPEIECFPYGRWNKSFRQIFAQVSVAHILGSTNLNISLHDFMGNRPDDEPERTFFLKKIRPNMDWLSDTFPMSLKSTGVGVPWSEDMGRHVHTTAGKAWNELSCPSRGWSYWLGAAGVSFSARPQERVNALSGPMVWSFNDETLKQWLSKGVLIDGTAAAILCERNLGKLIGVKSFRMIKNTDILYSMEECLEEKFAVRAGAQMSLNSKPYTHHLFQAELAKSATLISDIRNPLQEVVGHGTYIFTNELGGRVAVAPWNASAWAMPMMDIHRATQLQRLVKWLAARETVGAVSGGAWLVPQFLRDGTTWRGVVWNVSPDEIDTFTVQWPADMPPVQEAWHLTPAGERFRVPIKDNIVSLGDPLRQWEYVVFL